MRKDNRICPDEKYNTSDIFARSSRQHVYEISAGQMGDDAAPAVYRSNDGHDYEPVRQQMG